jgi:hypothetical protein
MNTVEIIISIAMPAIVYFCIGCLCKGFFTKLGDLLAENFHDELLKKKDSRRKGNFKRKKVKLIKLSLKTSEVEMVEIDYNPPE